MNKFSSLSHTVWDCKYHIVWIPKCRRKVLYGKLRHVVVQTDNVRYFSHIFKMEVAPQVG